MKWNYGFYALKRNALGSNGEAKMLAEDAALQVHPSCIQLRELWYGLSVLERAVHMHRLATTFKKTAIARNIGKDEGTVRRYVAVAKLPSYWKCRIDGGSSYDRVLKDAMLEPRRDGAVEVPARVPDPKSGPAKPIISAADGGPLPEGARPISTNVRDTAGLPGSSQANAPLKASIPLGSGLEKAVAMTAVESQSHGGVQNAEPSLTDLSRAQSSAGRGYVRPKTELESRLERKLQQIEQKLKFYRSPNGRTELECQRAEIERQLAALSRRRVFGIASG